MAHQSHGRTSPHITYLRLNDQNLPTRAEMFKCHDEYVKETDPIVKYASHEVAGIQEGPDVLADQAWMRTPHPCHSFIKSRAYFHVLQNCLKLNDELLLQDFFLVIRDAIRGTICKVQLHRGTMRLNRYARTILNQANGTSRGNTRKKPQKIHVGSLWYRAEAIRFGLEMLHGKDPCEWFREENVDLQIPTCISEVARASIQSMVLIIEYLNICGMFDLPAAYQDLGLYVMRKELNVWNLELLLSYIVGQPDKWDDPPATTDQQLGTTFEPLIPAVVREIDIRNTYQVVYADASMLAIVAEFFNNNMPPLADIATPCLYSAILGALPLERSQNSIWTLVDGGCLPPLPPGYNRYRPSLATFRIAMALRSNPYLGPSVWQDCILPMILVSLPYGLLKFLLYELKILDVSNRYALALRVCQWRTHRNIQWRRKQEKITGKSILWKRPHWNYEPDKMPSFHALPNRYRWIEVPFFVHQSDRQGRIKYIFDFKRYWYQWQEYEGRELQLKNQDIGRVEVCNIGLHRVRFIHTESNAKEVILIQHSPREGLL